MALDPTRFGTDLRLLGNLEHQESRLRGSDLFLTQRGRNTGWDLETLSGAQNLQQALLLRFLTPLGELAALGHPDYGCRLYELIGELNNDSNRNRARMYVLQALSLEPRVQQILSLTVTQNTAYRDEMDIKMTLQTIVADTPLNLVFRFNTSGGGTTG